MRKFSLFKDYIKIVKNHLRTCCHYKKMQICESDFPPLRGSDDAAHPEVRKEELTKKRGNIGRKDAFSLVATGPNSQLSTIHFPLLSRVLTLWTTLPSQSILIDFPAKQLRVYSV